MSQAYPKWLGTLQTKTGPPRKRQKLYNAEWMDKGLIQPAVVVVFKSHAGKVRAIARELNLSFEEEQVPGQDEATKFRFAPMNGVTSSKLALAIPREAFIKRATFE